MDAGRRASSDRLHFLADLPQRDVDELAGFVVGEQVEAGKPWPLLGAGGPVLGEADNLVEPFSARDHGRGRSVLCGPARIAIRLRAVLHGPGVPWDTEAV